MFHVNPLLGNTFCPTGKGGGIDPTCGKDGNKQAVKVYQDRVKKNRARMSQRDREIDKKYKAAGITEDHSRDGFNGMMRSANGEIRQRREMEDWMRAREKPIGLREHGMPERESMFAIKVDGTYIAYTENTRWAAAQTMLNIHNGVGSTGNVPDRLWKANKQLVFSENANSADEYWAKRYKVKEFSSSATGGDGSIVFYSTTNAANNGSTFYHESGHNVAVRQYGNTEPSSGSFFARAAKSEPPVTSYAKLAKDSTGKISEDFAETVAMFYDSIDRKRLQREFPKKYRAMELLFQGNN